MSRDHERPEVWVIVRRMIKALGDLGAPFPAGLVRPFTLEIVTPSLSTHASPVTRNVHVVPGESILNIVHESMHIWAYDHTAVVDSAPCLARCARDCPRGLYRPAVGIARAAQAARVRLSAARRRDPPRAVSRRSSSTPVSTVSERRTTGQRSPTRARFS
jgi:hypothetical protein